MRKTLLAFALVAAGSLGALAGSLANAQAADQPSYTYYKKAPEVFSWNGFYIKGELGYAVGDVDFAGFGQSFTVEPRGVTGTVGLGYNFHLTQNWVLGLEVDAGYLGGKQSTPVGPATISADLNYYGTVTGNVSYSFGTWRLGVKGGYAWGHIGSDVSVVNLSADDFIHGYAYGAFAEFALSRNWSLTAEALRLDFRTASLNYGPGSLAADAVIDTYKLGARYRF